MAVEEVKIVGVEHRGERGDVLVRGDAVEFRREREEAVKPDYSPAYRTEAKGERRSIPLDEVEGVTATGARARLRTRAGEEQFAFAREPDAEQFVAAIEERLAR